MSISDATSLYHLLNQAGPGGVAVMAVVLVMVVVGSIRGWWFSAPAYKALDDAWRTRFQERDQAWKERFDELKEDRDGWKILALSTGRTAATSVQVAEAAIRATPAP